MDKIPISRNDLVQNFLEEIMIMNYNKFNIINEIRKIVFDNNVKTSERIMYGGIMFTIENDFGGVFLRKNHISLEFINGFQLKDENNLLEGTGKFRRHLKIRALRTGL